MVTSINQKLLTSLTLLVSLNSHSFAPFPCHLSMLPMHWPLPIDGFRSLSLLSPSASPLSALSLLVMVTIALLPWTSISYLYWRALAFHHPAASIPNFLKLNSNNLSLLEEFFMVHHPLPRLFQLYKDSTSPSFDLSTADPQFEALHLLQVEGMHFSEKCCQNLYKGTLAIFPTFSPTLSLWFTVWSCSQKNLWDHVSSHHICQLACSNPIVCRISYKILDLSILLLVLTLTGHTHFKLFLKFLATNLSIITFFISLYFLLMPGLAPSLVLFTFCFFVS